MALTHTTAIRNQLADLVVDAIDAGTMAANGDLEIGTTAFGTILSTIEFLATSFGAASGGTATLLGVPLEDSSATGGGTAAVFRTRDRDGTEIFQGTVTATSGGGDMELSSTTINAADAVRINSFTYSASL
jgi:hypothetical protein